MPISKSDIVCSLAGRTAGRLFYVLDTVGGCAIIADGKRHKLAKPKRKNQKHLRFVAEGDKKVADLIKSGGEVLDSGLRRSLKEFSGTCSHNPQCSGVVLRNEKRGLAQNPPKDRRCVFVLTGPEDQGGI